jgi:hypothetical protein
MREHVGIQQVFPEFFTEYLRSNNEAVGWVVWHGLGFPPEAIYTAFADFEPEGTNGAEYSAQDPDRLWRAA